MALPLIIFTTADNPESGYFAQLVKATVKQLSAQFKNIPLLCPVFVCGNSGKKSLLATLLAHAHPSIAVKNAFECEEEADDGVYVWPEPVTVGDVTLMLLKLRKPIDDRKDYMELRRKVKAALVMLCSVCCLCDEQSLICRWVREFVQDHSSLSQCLHLQVSKLLVFIDDDWFKKGKEKAAFEQQINSHAPLIDVVRRSESWISTLSSHLSDPGFHAQFTSSHSHLLRDSQYMPRFLFWTDAFVRVANLNLGFETYLSKLPDTRDPEVEQRLVVVLERAARADVLRENGEALQFVIEEKLKGGGLRHVLDPHVIAKLQQTYKLEEPTVVLMLMGAQGHGKSTLLDYIVQFCAEIPQLPDIFKVGNTGGHTTKGSQVLSHPLLYREHQVMLIDLEGLGGTETASAAQAIIQKNLVSALLTVASVPCILVSNAVQSLHFVSETVAQIAKLQVEFGFLVERIYLLFQDKELLGENELTLDGGRENQDFLLLVAQLNLRHFDGSPVVKILNKPNFVAENIGAQRQLFLTRLLDNSLYVKKNASGTNVNIAELLAKINLIATHDKTDFRDLRLDPFDLHLKEAFVSRKKLEIQAIQYKTKSVDNLRLLVYFNEAIRLEFMSDTEDELALKSAAFRKHCWATLNFQLNSVRAELLGVEACYNFILVVPQEQMKKNINNLVKYFYKTALCLVTFLKIVKKQRGKLKQVKRYFPESSAAVDSLLQTMKTRRDRYIVLSTMLYTLQIGLTVASVGVGAFVGASLTAARTGVAAAEGAAIVSGRIVAGAALGFGVGLGGNTVVTGGFCSTMLFVQKAKELVWINAMWGNRSVNEGVFKLAKGDEKQPHLTAGAPKPVLLFLGSKNTLVSEFANYYVRHMAPFTPADFESFSPNKYAQVLPFDYYHPGQGKQLTRCYLLCLRMKKHFTSQHYQAMLKVAETLLPAASVACILVEDPSHYAQPLLSALCPPPGHFAGESKMKTKVLVLHKEGIPTEDMADSLTRGEVHFELKQMEDFRHEQIAVMIETIKGELDRSEVQGYSAFRGKVDSLASVLKQLSS